MLVKPVATWCVKQGTEAAAVFDVFFRVFAGGHDKSHGTPEENAEEEADAQGVDFASHERVEERDDRSGQADEREMVQYDVQVIGSQQRVTHGVQFKPKRRDHKPKP